MCHWYTKKVREYIYRDYIQIFFSQLRNLEFQLLNIVQNDQINS